MAGPTTVRGAGDIQRLWGSAVSGESEVACREVTLDSSCKAACAEARNPWLEFGGRSSERLTPTASAPACSSLPCISATATISNWAQTLATLYDLN